MIQSDGKFLIPIWIKTHKTRIPNFLLIYNGLYYSGTHFSEHDYLKLTSGTIITFKRYLNVKHDRE